jgi:hypothetical protein
MFTISSGLIRITDPCYEEVEWGTFLGPAKNGNWEIESDEDQIEFYHKDYKDYSNQANIEISVDSGQIGMFDNSLYPTEAKEFEYEGDTFYSKCCKLTCEEGCYGELSFGAVSSTYIGDGVYKGRVFYKDDLVVRVVIKLRYREEEW